MTWSEAFRQQAEGDYRMFKFFSSPESETPICYRLQFLQMSTEKLAKSHLLGSSTDAPKKTHSALVDFIRVVGGNPAVRAQLKFGHHFRQWKAYIESLIPLAERVENLAPAGGMVERLNPEYPWRSGTGEVICPAAYDFPEFTHNELIRLARFIDGYLNVNAGW